MDILASEDTCVIRRLGLICMIGSGGASLIPFVYYTKLLNNIQDQSLNSLSYFPHRDHIFKIVEIIVPMRLNLRGSPPLLLKPVSCYFLSYI
jgi:hypothetical protein